MIAVHARDTLQESIAPPRRKFYLYAYIALSVTIILMVATTVVIVYTVHRGYVTFGLETAAMLGCAAYWTLKTIELRQSRAEQLAIRGYIESEPMGARALIALARFMFRSNPQPIEVPSTQASPAVRQLAEGESVVLSDR